MSAREEKSVDHPQAVIEKAQRLGQLLQRVEQGEVLAEVCVEIGVEVTPDCLLALQRKYEAGGCRWEALIDGRHGHEQKVTADMKEWLYERKRQDKTLTGPELVKAIKDKFGVELSVGHINHLLRQVELSRQTGRPPKPVVEKETETVEISESVVDNAGLFFPGGS
jgi:transposase